VLAPATTAAGLKVIHPPWDRGRPTRWHSARELGGKISPSVTYGGDCSGKPCWKATATGFQFKDKYGNADGLTKIKLKAGMGTAILSVKGRGAPWDAR